MPDIDWQFVERITRPAANWPQSKREEWDRLRFVNGKRPEGENMAENRTAEFLYKAAHDTTDNYGFYMEQAYNALNNEAHALRARVAELGANQRPTAATTIPAEQHAKHQRFAQKRAQMIAAQFQLSDEIAASIAEAIFERMTSAALIGRSWFYESEMTAKAVEGLYSEQESKAMPIFEIVAVVVGRLREKVAELEAQNAAAPDLLEAAEGVVEMLPCGEPARWKLEAAIAKAKAASPVVRGATGEE